MNIIKQINAEIERLRATNPSEYNEQNAIGYVWALNDILSFLSTLEPEKPIILDGLEEELDKWRHKHFHGKRDDHFSDEYLERTSQLDLARHFAEWQKEKMMKEAMEGRIHLVGFHNAIYTKEPQWTDWLDKFEEGDKVRVILLPKED